MSRFNHGENCKGFGCLPRCSRKRTWNSDRCRASALKVIEPSLKCCLRRVHNAGVDVPDLGKCKQVGCMLSVAKLVGRCLIDRYGAGTCRRVWVSPNMNLASVKTEFLCVIRHSGRDYAVKTRLARSYLEYGL